MDSSSSMYRSFGGIEDEKVLPKSTESTEIASDKSLRISRTVQSIREGIIGSYSLFTTPYGEKPIVYADWTASGRALRKVEDYMLNEVMPDYANTHTASSITGHQSTCYRHEARQIIAESVNAKVTGKAAEDLVLFVGNGTTAAVMKLIGALGLNVQLSIEDRQSNLRPIVFTSCYEHHSNLLTWRETACEVVTIAYHPVTGICLHDLESKLTLFSDRKVKIGAFSAASNVTGLLTDVESVSIILHRYGALAFFDYATAAPYVKIDMNPVISGRDAPYAYKDAIYFSGHKFVGGPGCPGVLVVKKRVMPQPSEVPTNGGGGGTVFYVTDTHHRYMYNREEREEGGTPNVLADIKMGLVMHVKQTIGSEWIESEELKLSAYVSKRFSEIPNLLLLGRGDSSAMNRVKSTNLPIYSFLVRCGPQFLHYSFVCALLNDLFGVQSRGGCMCAGPYSQAILGLTAQANQEIETALLDKNEVLRPGYSRISFPYWLSKTEVDYIIDAIALVAKEGWKFLSAYKYNHKTGEWAHSTRLTRFPERKWLSYFDHSKWESSRTDFVKQPLSSSLNSVKTDNVVDLMEMTRSAAEKSIEEVNEAINKLMNKKVSSMSSDAISTDNLRWFVLYEDVYANLKYYVEYDYSDTCIKGPIQPFQPCFHQGTAHTSDSSLPDKSSAYAAIRSQKLCVRNGDEENIPRYISLQTTNPSSDNFLQILKSSEHNTVAPSSSELQKKKRETVDGIADALVETAIIKKSEVVNNAAEEPSFWTTEPVKIESVCVDGTCSFKPRIDAEKILSGAGSTIAVNPALINKANFRLPPKKIMKLVGNAVKEWGMIEEGDRLLLGLSGGKDSLALLQVLIALQKRAPVKFEIACATVDPQTESFDPSPLIPYVQSLGITYHYLSEPIVELAKSKLQGDSLCAFCSRFKRGLLYSCCRNNKYNKLVLAQHLDDLAESFMMSALHNGQIRTMKANYNIEAGDVRVIRPLIYVREKATREFSITAQLPIINENCPACFEQPKERARMKKLLAQEEAMIPELFFNLRRAFIPLMHDDAYNAMAKIADEIEKAGYSYKSRLPQLMKSSKRQKQSDSSQAEEPFNNGNTDELANEDHLTKKAKVEVEPTPMTEVMCETKGQDRYCAACYELV